MDEVEARVLAWRRARHAVLQERASVTRLLKDCIERKAAVDPALFADLAGALDDLERIQARF